MTIGKIQPEKVYRTTDGKEFRGEFGEYMAYVHQKQINDTKTYRRSVAIRKVVGYVEDLFKK